MMKTEIIRLTDENKRLKNQDIFNKELIKRLRIEMVFKDGINGGKAFDDILKNMIEEEREDTYE